MARVKRRNTKKRAQQVKALHPALALGARRKSNLHCSVLSRVLRQTYTLHGHTSNSVDLEGLTIFVSLRKVDEIMLGLTPPPLGSLNYLRRGDKLSYRGNQHWPRTPPGGYIKERGPSDWEPRGH